jgi:hypothetical protein
MVPTKRWPGLGYLTEIWLAGRRLLLTFVIASFLGYLLGNLLPARWISGLFGDGTGWSVPLGATLGLPFYLNISSSLPIARAFMAHGATPGAAMAFLLVGAGTSIGAVARMLTIVRWRVAALVTVTLCPRLAQRGCYRANPEVMSESRSELDARPVREGRNSRMESKTGSREHKLGTSQEKRS